MLRNREKMAKDRLGKDTTLTKLQLQTRYHIWSNLTFKNLVRPLYAFFFFFLFFFFSFSSLLLLLLLLIPFYRWSDEEIAVSGRLTHLESTMLTFNQVSDSKPVLLLLCHEGVRKCKFMKWRQKEMHQKHGTWGRDDNNRWHSWVSISSGRPWLWNI